MNDAPLKVAFATFGCKVNQYETAAIREAIAAGGHEAVAPDAPADVYVVNTCTVTARADQKGRQAIRRLHRRAPGARIIVTGCGVGHGRARLAALPGVTDTVPNAGKGALPALLAPAGRGTPPPQDPLGAPPPLRIARFPGHLRAFLKIQDGCHLNCTYCIIPRVRGGLRSKPVADVLAEAAAVATHHPEIVLTGIHLGGWGLDLRPRWHVADLLPRLARTPGLQRLRLSSLEFQEVTPALVEVLASGGTHAPHLHLPLQSGSDRILRAMKRGYRRRTIDRSVDALRRAVPGLGLSTDVIVGFPGESEADFAATLEACRSIGFHRIHRFPYSVRPGTPAASLPDAVPEAAVRARMAALAEVEAHTAARHAAALRGRSVAVLVEHADADDPTAGIGYTGCYMEARVAAGGDRRGALVSARVTGFDGTRLLARPDAPSAPAATRGARRA